MTADSPLKIQPLEKYRATMTKEEVADALGVTQEAIDEFHRRVVAGEFAQEHKTPSRKDRSA